MASDELELDPLLHELRNLVCGDGRSKLKGLMKHKIFSWAATYVITDACNIVFKTNTVNDSAGRNKQKKPRQLKLSGEALIDPPTLFILWSRWVKSYVTNRG